MGTLQGAEGGMSKPCKSHVIISIGVSIVTRCINALVLQDSRGPTRFGWILGIREPIGELIGLQANPGQIYGRSQRSNSKQVMCRAFNVYNQMHQEGKIGRDTLPLVEDFSIKRPPKPPLSPMRQGYQGAMIKKCKLRTRSSIYMVRVVSFSNALVYTLQIFFHK